MSSLEAGRASYGAWAFETHPALRRNPPGSQGEGPISREGFGESSEPNQRAGVTPRMGDSPRVTELPPTRGSTGLLHPDNTRAAGLPLGSYSVFLGTVSLHLGTCLGPSGPLTGQMGSEHRGLPTCGPMTPWTMPEAAWLRAARSPQARFLLRRAG